MMWDVVPVCENQKRDVNPNDLLKGGLYRKCCTYKSGGGYDRFPDVYRNLVGESQKDLSSQFVVQLRGCVLNCPYCYVTRDGVWGDSVKVSTEKLVEDFKKSSCGVFHLMGGSPAIYLTQWSTLLEKLDGEVFHSDFVLFEQLYDEKSLREIAEYENAVFVISIKGATLEGLKARTGNKHLNLFHAAENYRRLRESGIKYYFTFTGMSDDEMKILKDRMPWEDFSNSFSIPIIKYEAVRDVAFLL